MSRDVRLSSLRASRSLNAHCSNNLTLGLIKAIDNGPIRYIQGQEPGQKQEQGLYKNGPQLYTQHEYRKGKLEELLAPDINGGR